MLSLLQKVSLKIVCIVDENKFIFENCNKACESLKEHYYIELIYLRDKFVVFELKEVNDLNDWIMDHVKQFGEELIFFDREEYL